MPLPTRKPNRLPFGKIYKSNNGFFITVCTHDKHCVFGSVDRGKDKLSPTGAIVKKTWLKLIEVFENVELGEFVVMPNHFHGIIAFLNTPIKRDNQKEVDLSQIIGWFKAYSQKLIRESIVEKDFKKNGSGRVGEDLFLPQKPTTSTGLTDLPIPSGKDKLSPTNNANKPNYHKIWQKSFYDHVIRDEKDLRRVEEYIVNNPLNWELDSLNPSNIK